MPKFFEDEKPEADSDPEVFLPKQYCKKKKKRKSKMKVRRKRAKR
jgi:hypothetical protein